MGQRVEATDVDRMAGDVEQRTCATAVAAGAVLNLPGDCRSQVGPVEVNISGAG